MLPCWYSVWVEVTLLVVLGRQVCSKLYNVQCLLNESLQSREVKSLLLLKLRCWNPMVSVRQAITSFEEKKALTFSKLWKCSLWACEHTNNLLIQWRNLPPKPLFALAAMTRGGIWAMPVYRRLISSEWKPLLDRQDSSEIWFIPAPFVGYAV